MSSNEVRASWQRGRAGLAVTRAEHRSGCLAWGVLRRDKAAVASAGVIALISVLALAAPAFATLTGHGPTQQFPNTGLSATGVPVGPGLRYWFGADELGRDLFVRVLYGARVSLLVAAVTTVIGTALGVGAGLAAGYCGGWLDALLSRVVDAVLAFPYIVLALALGAVFGSNFLGVIGVISFFAWSGIARVVRGQTIALKERDYVEAARSLGAGPGRIMFLEILPNLSGVVLTLAALSIPFAITFEATLSFLGLGIQPPAASWGNILADAQNYYGVAWWYLVFPALALLVTTLAFNLLADSVGMALSPRPNHQATIVRRPGRRRTRRLAQRAAPVPPPAAKDEPETPAPIAAWAPSRPAARPAARPARLRDWLPALRFLVRRIIAGGVVLWAVSTAVFALFFTRPAISVARSFAGKESSASELRQITSQLGLSQPVIEQYARFMGRLLHGKLGYSYATGEPVTTILSRDLPRTASVVLGAAALWLVAGISAGILSAVRSSSKFDRAATVGALAGLSIPTFILGQLLLLGVFLQLNKHGITWIQGGYAGPTQGLVTWAGHMILPWITLAATSAAVYFRLSRNSMLEALNEDYIKTAQAKGLSEWRITTRHAFRAALTPIISQLGIDLGTLLGGAVVVEEVFGIGGIGQDSVQAFEQGNLPLIIGVVLVTALFVVVANIIVDFCYTLLDPRVRLHGKDTDRKGERHAPGGPLN